jgi:sugar porter (SP) family MFS transporter
VVGAIGSGGIGQKIGGRATLQILAALYVVSAMGCALAWSWPALLAARFIGGLAIGGSSVLGPVYIAEIAPPSHRGRLVGLFQINIVVGILVAYLSNLAIVSLELGAREWRWEFGVASLPALLFLLMLLDIPQSPRWLAMTGNTEEARQSLRMIGVKEPDAELNAILDSVRADAHTSGETLFQRRYLRPILLATGIATFNQLSGINAVLYYLNDIFASAGFSRLAGNLRAVVIGCVNLIFTLVAMTLIDRYGRRVLLLTGSAGMTLCLGGIAVIFHMNRWPGALLFLMAAFIAFFAVSSGAVVWVYMSEVFPNRVRVQGQALGSAVLWIMNGIVSQLFPVMKSVSATLPFVCFAVAMATQLILALTVLPETKGLSLEQLQETMRGRER